MQPGYADGIASAARQGAMIEGLHDLCPAETMRKWHTIHIRFAVLWQAVFVLGWPWLSPVTPRKSWTIGLYSRLGSATRRYMHLTLTVGRPPAAAYSGATN